ncbi:MAG: autotransporter domain-containing protein, partial [Planctomycetota bacterium]|nr:autotransporter domain-containing protein [Planctomycetota bacterium]
AADANVIFNDVADSGSIDYDGISGAGDIIKTGAGGLKLFGDYRNFDGDYNFGAGTVYFNNLTQTTLPASATTNVMTVASGATVDLATPTTLVNVGTLTMADGAFLNAAIDGLGNDASRINARAADVGAVTVNIDGDMYVAGSYTLVHTDAGNLIFDDQDFSTVLRSWHLTNENDQNLVLVVDELRRIASVGVTRNQRSVGDYLQTRATHPLYKYLYDETDLGRILLALDANSGDVYASTAASVIGYDRRGADMIVDRAQAVFFADAPASGAIASDSSLSSYSAAKSGAAGVWAEIDGYYYRSDSDRNAAEGITRGYGLALGVDKLSGDWLFGAAFRYGDGELKVDDRYARSDIASYSGALYAGRRACVGAGVLHVLGGVNGGYHDFEARRDSIVGAEINRYQAGYSGKSMDVYLDAGYTFGDVSGFTFQPFGTVMWNGYWNDEIRETGANPLYALEGKSELNDYFSTVLGVRMTARVGTALAIDAGAGWRHTYGDVEPVASMKFRSDPLNDRFNILGTPLKANEGVLGAGMTLNLTECVSLRAAYDYTFGADGSRNHEGRANLGIKF